MNERDIVYAGSNKPAIYIGLNENGLHKFIIFKSQPYTKMYFKVLPNIKPCNAYRVYATQIYLEEGDTVLFETSKGLASDQISIIMDDYFLLDSGFKLAKKRAFVYEEIVQELQGGDSACMAL